MKSCIMLSEISQRRQILHDFTYICGILKTKIRASLVAQWLRIHLPMQGTRVQFPVWEDPTCRRATKPVRHNY